MKAFFQNWLGIYLRGVAIGIAEVVPGISGGTIAFISGIYARLLLAIGHFNWQWVKCLSAWSRGKAPFQSVTEPIDAGFLFVLALGMVSALLVAAHWVNYLIQQYPLLVWACLFGLIAGAIVSIAIKAGRPKAMTWPLIALGVWLGFSFSTLQPSELTPNPLLIVTMGALASCAWILPGISGSFLLLISGFYPHFILALTQLNLGFIGWFGLGVAIGLPAFSRILSQWLQHYSQPTLWFLLAFMAGALRQVWPWQQVFSYYYLDESRSIPLATQPIMPSAYLEITGNNPEIISVLALIAFGAGCIAFIEWLASK